MLPGRVEVLFEELFGTVLFDSEGVLGVKVLVELLELGVGIFRSFWVPEFDVPGLVSIEEEEFVEDDKLGIVFDPERL